MTSVRVSVNLKRSIGYNSVSVGVDIEDEVRPNPSVSLPEAISQHVERLYELASSSVDEKVSEAVRQLEG